MTVPPACISGGWNYSWQQRSSHLCWTLPKSPCSGVSGSHRDRDARSRFSRAQARPISLAVKVHAESVACQCKVCIRR